MRIFRLLTVLLVLSTTPHSSVAQWVRMDIDSVFVTSFAADGGPSLFAGTSVFTGVYRSTNDGATWTQSGLSGRSIQSVVTSPNGTGDVNIFAGSYALPNCISLSGGVFLSSDKGASWTGAGTGQTYEDVYALTAGSNGTGGTSIFAATADCLGNGYGVFLSTNNGTTWVNVTNELTTSCVSPTCWVDALALIGTNLFAGTVGRGVFLSTNSGTNWTELNSGLTIPYVQTFGANETNVFVGTWGNTGGVFRSTNNGVTWTEAAVGLTDSHVQALVVIGANLFVGTEGSGIFLSTNNGTSWAQANTGLTDGWIMSLTVVGSYLFAGSNRSGVWRRPLLEMITGVEEGSAERPERFSLHQNYPNPFNPATNISFEVPSKSPVLLSVFDVLGREVSTLVAEEMPAGVYTQQWNASGFAGGVYFYRLRTGAFVETKKLVLLK